MPKRKKPRSGYKLELVEEDCPECEGKGFKEYQAGLIQIECLNCKGTGKIMRRRKVKEQRNGRKAN